jgi:arylsulfatase A-like enzyme
VLEVPLVVSPAAFDDARALVRGQDIPRLIRKVAGIPEPAGLAAATEPDELFLGEMKYVTYRKGRFKSVFHREQLSRWALFDLESDPGEQHNRISEESELARAHLQRVMQLAGSLAAEREQAELTPDDRERLESLGYLEPGSDPDPGS